MTIPNHTNLNPSSSSLLNHSLPLPLSPPPLAQPTNHPFNNHSKPHRHSFWAGLGFKDRSNTKLSTQKNSSLTLATYSHQPVHNSSTTLPAPSILPQPITHGPSRVIAMVGNIRTGIGRMILEQLVSQRFIVVALIEKPDSHFSKSVQALATSPSLFHAFVLESGLFDHQNCPSARLDQPAITPDPIPVPSNENNHSNHHHQHHHHNSNSNNINNHLSNNINTSKRSSRSAVFKSFRLNHYNKKSSHNSIPHISSTTTGSSTIGDSTTELSSYSSLYSKSNPPPHPSQQDPSRRNQVLELKNLLQAYRVDTVICSFEPQLSEPPTGPRSKARLEDEKQFGLSPSAERSRIERMERVVLEACLVSGSVHRFAVTVHPTSLGPSVLSPKPSSTIHPHLLTVLSDQFRTTRSPPPIHITEFRWGFLMNDLAFGDSLAYGTAAENGLGKWLCEPPRSRWVIDFARRRSLIPVRNASPNQSAQKGKQRLEPVCMTLAEDVARFAGLACKLKQPWQWNTGRIVGDCVPGGWEETIETIEKISRKKLDREYVCLNSLTNGYTSDSGSSDSSLYRPKSLSNSDPLDPSRKSQSPKFSVEEGFQFEDELRSILAKENQDASSVRMREFVRVWFTPLKQPPPLTIDGSRVRQKTSVLAPRGCFKPQVAENGTLREPTQKATAPGDRNKTNGPNPQFLSVPAPQSFSPSDDNHSTGHAISTDAPPTLPPISYLAPLHVKAIKSAKVLNAPSTTRPEEFNFVPKVIVPFNTNQLQLHATNGSTPAVKPASDSSQSWASSHPSSNASAPKGVVTHGAPVPVGTQQPQAFQENLSPPGSRPIAAQDKTAAGSFIYRQPPSTESDPNNNNRFIHKPNSLSLAVGRDDNRIIRRSPLATRVA